MKRDIVSTNGKDYLTTKLMSQKWGIGQKEISNYCKENRIPGAFKDSRNNWLIPYNSIKPINLSFLKKMLVFSLSLKSDTANQLDENVLPLTQGQTIKEFYLYLNQLGYIADFDQETPDNRIPYIIEVTRKGFEILGSNQNEKTYKPLTYSEILQTIALIVSISQLIKSIILG